MKRIRRPNFQPSVDITDELNAVITEEVVAPEEDTPVPLLFTDRYSVVLNQESEVSVEHGLDSDSWTWDAYDYTGRSVRLVVIRDLENDPDNNAVIRAKVPFSGTVTFYK